MVARQLGHSALVGVALTLSGCGQMPPVPTPAPPPPMQLSIEYIMLQHQNPDGSDKNVFMANWLGRAYGGECNFQGINPGDLYKKVDDKCCVVDGWSDSADPGGSVQQLVGTNEDVEGNFYTCPVMQLSFLGWVRGYLNCETDQVVYAESCVPASVNQSNGEWPMTEAVAKANQEMGTYESCHCQEQKNVGSGCIVGKTFDGFAFFWKQMDEQCSTMPPAEMTV